MSRKRSAARFRLLARPVAAVGFGISIAMAACAAVGGLMDALEPSAAAKEEGGILAMVLSSSLTMLASAGLWLSGRSGEGQTALRRREASLAVAIIWGGTALFGALPFVIDAGYSPIDGFFEAASGFTTTGATIVTDIEGRLSRPLLLWRSLMQWLGGMGIVVLFVAVFPSLGVGGKHLFRSEVPGTSAEGLRPRIAETSFALWRLYLLFTLLETFALIALGMSPFEAVCHAFTTMSTGGFSTRDASVAAFDSAAIDVTISIFMLIAGVNFGLYFVALKGRTLRVFARSYEFLVYLSIVVIATVLIAVDVLRLHQGDPLQALRYALFTVATFVTSTGYVTEDYMAYPPASIVLIFIIMFIGGSSGSTAGGLKVERVAIGVKLAWAQIRRSFRPSIVQVIRMGRSVVHTAVLNDVAAFVIVFMLCLAFGTLFVSFTDGVPPIAAFGATLSCLSNMGPAPFYVGSDNFARYSDPAKVMFSLAMVLGRLEFFTLLSLLLPDFWRR